MLQEAFRVKQLKFEDEVVVYNDIWNNKANDIKLNKLLMNMPSLSSEFDAIKINTEYSLHSCFNEL